MPNPVEESSRIVQTSPAKGEYPPPEPGKGPLFWVKAVAIALVGLAAIPEALLSIGFAVPATLIAISHSIIALGASLGIGSAGLSATTKK